MRFLLIDRLTELRPRESARAVKAVSGSEDFFADHFPGNPVMPGVLITEAMAQTGGALITLSTDMESFGVMSLIQGAKFRTPVRPGNVLDLQVTMEAMDDASARVHARAHAAGREVASARIVYAIVPIADIIGARYVEFWRDIVRSWAAGLDAVPAGIAR